MGLVFKLFTMASCLLIKNVPYVNDCYAREGSLCLEGKFMN